MTIRATGPRSYVLGLDLLIRFANNPGMFLLDLAKTYPDLAMLRIMEQSVFCVTGADLVREVFIEQVDRFHRATLQKRLVGSLLGNGLVMTDGEFWRKQRKIMQPTFHAMRIDGFAQTMIDHTRQMLASWGQDKVRVRDVDQDLTLLALQIACKTLFDVEVDDDSAQVGVAMQEIQQIVADGFIGTAFPILDRLPLPANRRKDKAVTTLHMILDRIIAERQAEGRDHGDLLSMMILTHDENGEGMSTRQLRDEAMTLFIAGHETTAKAMVWGWSRWRITRIFRRGCTRK